MWCLVRLPDNVVLDVNVDSKAAGQKVLDRVSRSVFPFSNDCFCFAVVTAVIFTI